MTHKQPHSQSAATVCIPKQWEPTESVRRENPAFQAFELWLEQDLERLEERFRAFHTVRSLRKDLQQGRSA